MEMIAKMTSPLNQKLECLIDKLPEEVKNQFQEISMQLSHELRSVQEIATNSVLPVQRDVKQLSDSLNMLIFKPSVKGSVSEQTLEISWQEAFIRDQVSRQGGAGRPDITVVPFLDSCARIGQKIIIERKSGKQKYCGSHLHETIQHIKNEGAKFGILVYDAPENLVEKPILLTTIGDIFLAVCDVQTGGWKTSRHVFEAIQTVMPNIDANTFQVDIRKIEKTVEEMQCITVSIEIIRKTNNATIANCEKNQEQINKLEQLFFYYRQQLREHLTSKIVSANFQIKSS
jgi:hypothetical protein